MMMMMEKEHKQQSTGSTSSAVCDQSSAPGVSSPAVCPTAAFHSLHVLSQNLKSLLSNPFCSDAEMEIDGQSVPVHRCVLSARSAFFRTLFSRESQKSKFSLKSLLTDFKVEYDALLSVLGYLYSGNLPEAPAGSSTCADPACSHEACRPAIDYALQLLYCGHVFQIPELVTVSQNQLLNIVDNAYIEDIIPVLAVASISPCSNDPLLAKCFQRIANSDLEPTILEKELPPHVVSQVFAQQSLAAKSSGSVDIHVRRILKALDSDDIELVKMLLHEGRVTLDGAYALHYAAAYCDSKTTIELLDLGNSDVNLRNKRGFTVLHVAAMRKDPTILVGLLTKGANPSDVASDGRTALAIARRLTKAVDYNTITEEGKETPKDRLCIEILEQVESRDPLVGEAALTLALENENFRTKLIYLEKRVALARLLFPMQAKLAMKIAHVDGTSEFVGSAYADVDLNETPLIINKENLSRYTALKKTVELGKRFFPRCSQVLNRILDDNKLPPFSCLENMENESTRQRYDEMKAAVSEAYSKDKEEFEKSCVSSSSSTSSLRDYQCSPY